MRPRQYLFSAITCVLSAQTLLWASVPDDLPAEQLDWQVYPDAAAQVCSGFYQSPALDLPQAGLPFAQASLFADARQASHNQQGGTLLQGDVRLRRGPVYVLADTAEVNAARDEARLQGNISIRQSGILLRAEQGRYQLEAGDLQLQQAHYVLHEERMRGAAWQLEQQADGRVLLHDASLTTCAPDDRSWRLVASRIQLNQDSGFGDAYHVRMQIHRVPVFYLPWIRFPLDDRRHTGVLAPYLSYSSKNDSWDVIQPVYWNIAPNHDATFHPRYISDRGSMLGAEYRYLYRHNQGQVFYATLPDDRIYYQQDRWHLALQHQGQWQALNYRLDYAQASDHRYFRDLGKGGFSVANDDELLQQLNLNYAFRQWRVQGLFSGYQRLHPTDDTATSLPPDFGLLDMRQGRIASQQDYFYWPKLELSGSDSLGEHWRWSMTLDYSQFDKLVDRSLTDTSYQTTSGGWGAPDAERLFAEAGFAGDWRWPWAFVRPQLKWRHTRYQLTPYWADSMTEAQKAGLELEPSFSVPVASLDTGLFFERDARLFGQQWLQTLEPRLFAAYVPYQEQQDVPMLFDGAFQTFDINQLYRAERTTGRDRFGDIQKITLGVDQRLLDPDSGRELASLGVAREFYLDDRFVDGSRYARHDPLHPKNRDRNQRPYEDVRDASNIALQFNLSLGDRWRLRSALLWDPHFETTDRSNTSLSYADAQGRHISFGHTYTSNYQTGLQGPSPDTSLLDNYSYLQQAEEQYYVSAVLPLFNPRWRLFLKHAEDWKRSEQLDSLVGLEYTSCCWQIQLLYRDWVEYPDVNRPYDTLVAGGFEPRERDRGLFLQFVFRGLGGVGQSTSALLQEEIRGYTER